jgi:acyl-coenzyme A synthetase/AMP-(fatty) acid ligase
MNPSLGNNLAELICRRHKDAVTRPALKESKPAGINTYTYGALDYLSNKFATCLTSSGIQQGDGIFIVLPPSTEMTVAHLGALKAGAYILPFSRIPDQFFLHQSLQPFQIKTAILAISQLEKFSFIKEKLGTHYQVYIATDEISRNDFADGQKSFWYDINFADADFPIAKVESSCPAYFLLTSSGNVEYAKETLVHGDFVDSLEHLQDSDLPERGAKESIKEIREIDRSFLTNFYSLLYCGKSIDL